MKCLVYKNVSQGANSDSDLQVKLFILLPQDHSIVFCN